MTNSFIDTPSTVASAVTSTIPKLKFTPIPIFSSNYVWVIEHGTDKQAYIVDPGSSDEVLSYLEKTGLALCGILITHSHNDHIGGVNDIIKQKQAPVYGPKSERIPQVTHTLADADSFELWPEITARILHLPGHLPEHIVFFVEQDNQAPALFCGDVLFSSGCGRMFSGPAETYQHSLSRLASLPEATRIFCAHEYTRDNIRFAKHIEPHNQALDEKDAQAKRQIEQRGTSLPTTLGEELHTNPFLRTKNQELLTRLCELSGEEAKTEVEAFALLRALKDRF